MYKSPIDITFDELRMNFGRDLDRRILEAVQSYEINVDEDELLRALKYDRDQYSKGVKDGSPVPVKITNRLAPDYPIEGFWDKNKGVLYTAYIDTATAERRGYFWEEVKKEQKRKEGKQSV